MHTAPRYWREAARPLLPAARVCAQIDRQRAEETEAKRLQALPRYLSGKSFADEEDDSDDLSDVFEGECVT